MPKLHLAVDADDVRGSQLTRIAVLLDLAVFECIDIAEDERDSGFDTDTQEYVYRNVAEDLTRIYVRIVEELQRVQSEKDEP